jgi:hypothetical protein
MKMVSGLIDALERVRSGLGVKSRPALESAARELLAENRAMSHPARKDPARTTVVAAVRMSELRE